MRPHCSPPPEDWYALAGALKELDRSGLVAGRPRGWVVLSIAWAPWLHGEVTKLEEAARDSLLLARRFNDPRADAEAQCLLGDVFEAQGRLVEAQAALGEALTISRSLVEQEPTNAVWQRGLALACARVARMDANAGRPAVALRLYEEAAGILRTLTERAPDFAPWARERAQVELEPALSRRRVESVEAAGRAASP